MPLIVLLLCLWPPLLPSLHVQLLDPFSGGNGPVLVLQNGSGSTPLGLGLQSAMWNMHRMVPLAQEAQSSRRTRALKPRTRSRDVLVLEAPNSGGAADGGRCIISADQAVHFCGFAEEVNEPPIPPPLDGQCEQSKISGRTICYPRYQDLDTSCTDAAATSSQRSELVAPPVIKHANVRTMAFVPPDNLQRLIRQYYRQHGKAYPKNETDKFSSRSFLFVKYGCEPGYVLLDEAEHMFCRNGQWVQTPPVCRGKGLCERENGGCSHSCISFEHNRTVECRCPRGMVLDTDGKTCVKPVPKSLCRKLAGCSCSSVDDRQYSCSCPPRSEKCLLMSGPPKIYLEPPPDYQVVPGGSLNLTCASVAFPLPEIAWERGQEGVQWPAQLTHGTARTEQVLMIKEVYQNLNFTCHARNELGDASRLVQVLVTGPGSAPVLRELTAGRSSIEVHWDRPHIVNQPLTVYSILYSTEPSQPIKDWSQLNVTATTERRGAHSIPDLHSNTLYTIRIRAHDSLGPGKLSNPVSVRTLPPAKRPHVVIPEGPELRVPPKVPFGLNCNLSRGDPIPEMHWESRGRSISASQQSKHIAVQHSGLYESTEFQCVAENEAGRTMQKVQVLVTGPTQPERVRYHVDGNTVALQWDEPRITNGPMADYEVFFTEQPNLPDDQWTVRPSGGPLERALTMAGLKENTDYTFKIRGLNRNGPGLFSLPFTARTWLAPRPPKLSLEPEGQIQRRPSQEELEVRCEADGVPRPRLIWWWEGRPVEDGKGGFRVVDSTPLDAQVQTSQLLRFQSSTRSGTLKCQAVNERGVAEGTVRVQIMGPGSPPDQINVRPVQDGFSVHWRPPVVPNGEVVGYVLYWSKDPEAELADWSKQPLGPEATEATVHGQEEQTPYVVRLQAIGREGPGIISASYDVTTGLRHIPLTVSIQVLEPPVRPEHKEPPGTLVEPGQPIRFQCIADGRPKPTVAWSWVPSNGSSGAVHLALEPDSRGQPHRYVSGPMEANTVWPRTLLCEARNDQGQVQDGHAFRVLKPGGPPLDISPVVDVDNSVTLSWSPPLHPNSPLTGYVLLLSADPSLPTDQWRQFRVPADRPLHVFPRGQLDPETPYYVRVAAENEHGRGPLSELTHFVTLSGAPLDAPTDLLVQLKPDNSITASWGPPSQPNGPLQHYTVYFAPEDPADRDENYKRWNKVQMPVRADGGGEVLLEREKYGVLPEHEYRLRVSASNELSEGPPSAVNRFSTGTGEIAPTVAIEPANNPVGVAPLGDYSVMCQGMGLPTPTVWWTLGTSEDRLPGGGQLQLRQLTRDTTAICHAENNAGKAEMALELRVQGPGTPPNEVVAMPLPGQALAVEWTAPDEPNGKLTGYFVHFAEVHESETEPEADAWRQVRVGPDVNRHRLDGLKPKTLYSVRVQAVSDRGNGVLSEPVKARTLPLAPKAPDVLPVQVHPNNTVAVQFIPSDDPEQEGRKVQSYRILYTKQDPGLEDAQWAEVVWNVPPGVDPSREVQVFIDGENFDPETKYHVKVIPIGEIEGPPSEAKDFDTQTGVVAPDQPVVHVDTEGNELRVPAGTDYTVECTASGYPPPRISWTDAQGNVLSEGGMLRVFDIRQGQDFLCVADNTGGRTETPFRIYVTGPGTAPESVRLTAGKPKSMLVKWEPPTIPNGNITRYVIYYTPLDDQTKDLLVGQVPAKPVSEWMTTHLVGETVGTPGTKKVLLTDFVEPDTAYAVVVQAANQDGGGPYSNQMNIRTMSRARAAPPTHLLVEPINQTSVEVRWRAPEPGEEQPISYEIYYVPADKRIEEDETLSLPKWTRVEVPDPSQSRHMIWNALEPDTEYVFKIRALYPSGSGVFSEPCIAKTLPEGDAPFLVVSAGGRGTEGASVVQLLPGSDFTVFCRASGRPQPSVRWIRGGDIPIDPSTVKEDETGTKWSLSLVNISEPSTFNCVARNPLGAANWTIRLELVPGLWPDWLSQLVRPELRQGQLWLHFAEQMPESLRKPNQWTLRYTEEPDKERILWSVLESEDRPLTSIPVKSPAAPMLPGVTYHLVVENPEGIRSPVFTVLVPKAPSDLRVGSNINDEMVVDFRPAIAPIPVQNYLVKYWPVGKEGEETPLETVKSIQVPGNRTIGVRVPDLPRDAEFYFSVVAQLADGQELVGPAVLIRTPAKEIRCDCSHACRLLETDSVEVKVDCYCPDGWELAADGRTCVQPEPTEGPAVEVSPTFELAQQDAEQLDHGPSFGPPSGQHEPVASSPLPTDEYGNVVTADLGQYPPLHVVPTDSLGREIRPVVFFNGSQLRSDAEHNFYDQLGRKVERDEEQRALGPDGRVLRMDAHGNYVYPPLDMSGQPVPTDANLRPVAEVVDERGDHWPRDEGGRTLDRMGRPLPTDAYGQPMGPGSSPLPTNFHGQFVLSRLGEGQEEEEEELGRPLPTDSMGYPIRPVVFPDGRLLPTTASGQFLQPEGDEELARDEQGVPLDREGRPLDQNERGQFLWREEEEKRPAGDGRQPTQPPVLVTGPDGLPLAKDTTWGRQPTAVTEEESGKAAKTLPTDHGMVGPESTLSPSEAMAEVVDAEGTRLPTDAEGRPLDAHGRPLATSDRGLVLGPDGSPLPTNAEGQFVLAYPAESREQQQPSQPQQPGATATDSSGKPIHPVVRPDGNPLARDPLTGHYMDDRGEPLPTDAEGHPLDREKGHLLSTNIYGEFVWTEAGATEQPKPSPMEIGPDGLPQPDGRPAQTLPTDGYGRPIFPVVDENGNLLPTDESGHFVYPTGRGGQLPMDERGRPLDEQGRPLGQNARGQFVLLGRGRVPPAAFPEDHREGQALEKGAECRMDTAVVDMLVALNDELMQPSGLDHLRRTLHELLDRLDLAADGTRLGLLHFGKAVSVPVSIGGYHDRAQLLDTLDRLHAQSSLGVPDLAAAYEAAAQQLRSFGRPGVPQLLLVFISGEDISPDSARNAPANVFRLLVGPSSYDSEIAEASVEHILVDRWDSLTGERIADYLEGACHRGSLTLPKSRAKFVAGKPSSPSIAAPADGGDERPILAGGRPAPSGPSSPEQCAELQRRSRVLLAVETSEETSDVREELSQALLHFIREYVASTGAQLGILYYGDTVEVGVDVGNYQDRQELEESVQEMHFVGGAADHGLAIRTAQQLLTELPPDLIKVLLHVHRHPLGPQVAHDIEQIARTENIALLELDYNRWGVLENREPYWSRQLCMLEALIERLENTVPADIDEIFFGRPPIAMATPSDVLSTPTGGMTTISTTITSSPPPVEARVLPTDEGGRAVHPVLGPDGQLLAVDQHGHYLDMEGRPLPLDELGRPLDAEGHLLPQDNRGFFVLHTTGPDQSPPSAPKPTGPDGSPLPTDLEGKVLTGGGEHEVGRGEIYIKALPTDQTGRFIHPVLDALTGDPLATDHFGRYLEPITGELLPTDDFGRPLDPRTGQLLPTNELGQFLYSAGDHRALGTGAEGKMLPMAEPVVTEQGKPLPKDKQGRFMDHRGQPIPVDGLGRPLGRDGRPLSKNEKGQFVWRTLPAELSPDGLPWSTGRPSGEELGELLPVVDQHGRPMPTDQSGQFLDSSGDPIPLDPVGRPLDPQGRSLPTDRHGQFVYTRPMAPVPTQPTRPPSAPSPLPTDAQGRPIWPKPEEEGLAETLPTDGTGKLLYPVVSADSGLPLARNADGRYLDGRGELIPIDDFGRPLDTMAQVLPMNELGQFLFSEPVLPSATVEEGVVATAVPTISVREWTPGVEPKRRNDTRHCFLGGFMELLLVFDTSANVKILDYRMMKEAVKGFLLDHFDLRPNRGVRLGLLKYGDTVEVPVALGDYDSEVELLARLGETRRLKGEPNLELALKEAAGEFQLSGADDAPRVVMVWKSGDSAGGGSSSVRTAADSLRQQFGAILLVVNGAANGRDGNRLSEEDMELVGQQADNVFGFGGWRNADPDRLGAVADRLCRLVPQAKAAAASGAVPWPSRARGTSSTTAGQPSGDGGPRECARVDYPLDLIIALDSSNFEPAQFARILEALGTLADESFDLAPDVARLGLLVYSDRVAVPMALGHYEDKVELLSKLAATERLPGMPIALRGLEAARQQFQQNGRPNVARALMLVTNGKHRGNAAPVAQELRDLLGVQIYAVAIGASDEQLGTLARIVGGPELAQQRLLRVHSTDELADPGRLAFLRRALCARIARAWARRSTAAAAARRRGLSTPSLRPITDSPGRPPLTARRVTRNAGGRPAPLCPDGILRPFLLTFVLDMSEHAANNSSAMLAPVLAHLAAFVEQKFSVESQRVRLNLVAVDAHGVLAKADTVPVEEFGRQLTGLAKLSPRPMSNGTIGGPSRLAEGITAASAISAGQAIPGVHQLLMLVTGDGTSSDLVDHVLLDHQQLVAISVRSPHSESLRSLAGGSATRVIHFADWAAPQVRQQFIRWLAYAICETVQLRNGTAVTRNTGGGRTEQETNAAAGPSQLGRTTQMPKWRRLASVAPIVRRNQTTEPWDVTVRPLSPRALSVSWVCCSNRRPSHNYSVLFSPDRSLPFPESWTHREATCRDSFGLRLDGLSTNSEYTVCVLSSTGMERIMRQQAGRQIEEIGAEGQCDSVWLSSRSPAETEVTAAANSPNPPPGKQCPVGFRPSGQGKCTDVDECALGNGGCSHHCLNLAGGFFCACPPPLVLDPAQPLKCVQLQSGLQRAADLLAHFIRLVRREGVDAAGRLAVRVRRWIGQQ